MKPQQIIQIGKHHDDSPLKTTESPKKETSFEDNSLSTKKMMTQALNYIKLGESRQGAVAAANS